MTAADPPPFAAMEERVYAADLDDFVKERAAAAKELRAQGERGEAAAVAKLPKPSVAAWIVNRLARAEPGSMGELLEAGARLREVQLGAGSAADLRDASQAQDDAMRLLMRAAERAGGRATSATLERVRETLHAAALDADLAEQVRRGVLRREQRAVGFPMGLAIPEARRRPAPAAAAKPKPKPSRKAAETTRAAPRDEVGAKRRERAAAGAEKAQAELAEAESGLACAQDSLDAAEAELDDAREAMAAAERREKDARRAVERAEKVHTRAMGDAERALARLRELDERA
ncbi:MAG TPA: hypothetical protein VHI30_15030 [Gaiellales bacterium]|nr:hypothetical protein [Gaiellales bacterium]